MSDTITDFAGNVVTVGTRVVYWEDAGTPPMVGTVTEISDWDGDVDDDTGRSIMIEPDITVRWDDGTVETYRTCEWEIGYEYGGTEYPEMVADNGKVEELNVYKETA